jgi:hypothetical protein
MAPQRALYLLGFVAVASLFYAYTPRAADDDTCDEREAAPCATLGVGFCSELVCSAGRCVPRHDVVFHSFTREMGALGMSTTPGSSPSKDRGYA